MKYALTVSERQALAASVNLVELDIACGDLEAALQLGRPLALSLRHSGRRATHFELLLMVCSALLLAGASQEARALAAEAYDLALRFDPRKLYSALDAMAYLASLDGRNEAAARIMACAARAQEAHGQMRRRPVQEKLHAAMLARLRERLGPSWSASLTDAGERLDEAAACALALGLRE